MRKLITAALAALTLAGTLGAASSALAAGDYGRGHDGRYEDRYDRRDHRRHDRWDRRDHRRDHRWDRRDRRHDRRWDRRHDRWDDRDGHHGGHRR